MGGSRPALLLAAGALLLLVVVAARGESAVPGEAPRWRPHEFTPPPATPSVSDVEVTGEFPEQSPNESPVVDIVVGVVVLVLLVAFLLFLQAVVHGLRRRRDVAVRGAPAEVEGSVLLQDALEQARDVLVRAGGEPRDAVVRAWVTLENATEHGRAPHQTATEFTISLLEKGSADEDAVRQLRTLYHRARFGHHSGTADADAARAALDRILATIR